MRSLVLTGLVPKWRILMPKRKDLFLNEEMLIEKRAETGGYTHRFRSTLWVTAGAIKLHPRDYQANP